LLGVTLDEDDWMVEETWGGKGDAEATLTYEWGFSGPPEVESDASQELVNVLAICSGAHIVDESEITVCGSCDFDLCAACGDDGVFGDCPAVRLIPHQVQRVVATMPEPRTTELTMRWHRVGHDVALSEVGLITRTLNGTAADETVTAWASAGAMRTWVADAWEPVPKIRMDAATNAVEAVIVEIASLLALGTRADDQSEWYAISDSQ
jgi:hypothetical protein